MSLAGAIRRWPLRRRLIVGVTLLVLVTLLLSAAATVFALRASLDERLNQDVQVGLDLAVKPGPGGPGSDAPSGSGPRPRIDTLSVVFGSDGSVISSSYVGPDGDAVSLTATQHQTLWDAVESTTEPVTVDLGGTIGSFRVADRTVDDSVVVSGKSTRDVTATLTSLGAILGAVTLTAIIIAAAGIALLVSTLTHPLRRIADTAERVSQRSLAEGAVTLPERVELADDPRTEVGRVGAALDALLTNVEDALGARQESEDRLRAFIADASHELRTPLASIRGYAQLALADGADPARSLDRIESEAERMGRLVDDLLLLARLDAGQELRHEPVDLALIAIESVDDAHAADPTREWLVEVDEAVEIVGDPGRIRQVVINLLGNARMHTPPGTRVTTSVTHDDTHARITVADEGPGIAPDVLPRLFDRFARGGSARDRASGGAGLGLSIVSAIVQAHGGTVEVSSDTGGASFTVALPLSTP
ncbi:two-component sensor histidine kinase [Microbacterium sorbitolivorans]|uniref:sensor histidine kinase n=1 Tax=Microbacterium sorbitolivorans TaxID=1867410 RepID=UPI001999DDEC|nr:HAMP domain-containing sensor histidine kinase [Microbacterium sorbitolivorans]GGF48727.1 two-component sensor histidine kinase [Microbacterium sorbitolivorans]